MPGGEVLEHGTVLVRNCIFFEGVNSRLFAFPVSGDANDAIMIPAVQKTKVCNEHDGDE